MTMNTALQDARSRIAALDFDAENERLAAIAQQLVDIEAAQQRARERHEEILQLLRPFNAAHHLAASPVLNEKDGRYMADALLAGTDTSEAAEQRVTRDKLEHERDALRQGMTDLTRRSRELGQERDQLRLSAGRRILGELQPLCDQLEAQAREAAKVIEGAFASLSAIGGATRTSSLALQRTAAAVAGMRTGAQTGLLHASETVDVPQEITDLLGMLSDKGPAYNGRRHTSVQVRDPHAAATLGPVLRGPLVAVG